MHNLASKFDTSKELLVQRYSRGIQLVKPNPKATQTTPQSISNIFNLPTSSYFLGSQSQLVDVNDTCATALNASSIQSVLGKCPEYFSTKEFSNKIVENNNAVMRSASMIAIEEMGVRTDFFLQSISFKFPWYYENRIIGIFGCSIAIDVNSLGGFCNALTQLIEVGLLMPGQGLAKMITPEPHSTNYYFSMRENQVLSHLVRGKSAKEIGMAMGLSRRTIEHHIENIRGKTQCKSRSELIDKFVDRFINNNK